MNLTTQVVKLFETTKQERQSFALQLIDEIQNGAVNPLLLHLQVKCMEDVVKQVTSNSIYKKSIVDAAEQQGEKSFEFHNAKFEVKETGVKYDYSQCNDSVLNELNDKMEKLSEELKQRESFLKTVPQKGLEIITEGGEVVTVYPPAKSSTTNVAVTLK